MANKVSKLPSLQEFLEKNKAAFDLAVKAQMATIGSWQEQEVFLRNEWIMMSSMDDSQLENYLKARQERDVLHWKMVLNELNKLIDIAKKRERVDDDVREAREQQKWNRTRKSRRKL